MAPVAKIAPVEQVTFSVEAYGTFMTTLRGALAGASPDKVVGPKSKVERPVLAKQTGDNAQPPRWIHVVLGGKGGAAPKVAVRSDNAYIMGFTNSQGRWFQLSKTGTKDKLVDDNPVMLGFDGHYQTLVGGVANLTTLDVRRFSTAAAAAKLWNHTVAVANNNNLDDEEEEDEELRADQLKTAVATLCVVISEAARFTPVYSFIDDGWDKVAKVSITQKEVGYIKNWADISTALLDWKKDAYKNDAKHFEKVKIKGIGISDGEQALAAVQLVLQVKRALLDCPGVRNSISLLGVTDLAAATGYGHAPTDEQQLAYAELPKHGRYLAEVFAVRVSTATAGNRPPPCGTISFHGGHCCSDFIYSWNPTEEPTSVQTCDSQGNLVLTGPSVATSAYGPIIFNLDLHDGSRGSSSQEKAADEEDEQNTVGKMFCDVVGNDFSSYDRAIVETVRTGCGPADVTYAVLSNGVEGRVAVKLARLVGDQEATGVLGRITARSNLFDVGWVLFYNDSGKDDVRVRSGEMIPLARHVLAVPLHMPLTIELDLHCYSGVEIVRGALEFNPVIDGQHTEHITGMNGAELEVTISWSDYPW